MCAPPFKYLISEFALYRGLSAMKILRKSQQLSHVYGWVDSDRVGVESLGHTAERPIASANDPLCSDSF